MIELYDQLEALFAHLSIQVDQMNADRQVSGAPLVRRARVQLLGQISLFCHRSVSAILSLAQTGDLDAHLTMDQPVKEALKRGLATIGLIYDEDSNLIWIPPDAVFETVFDFENILVEAIDAESALVSKAVKAPEKNRQLIREAVASGNFEGLAGRIVKNGGSLENFV